MKIFIFLRSIFSYFLLLIIVLILIPPCLVIMCLPEKYRYDNRAFFFLLDLFYKGALMVTFFPVKITGKNNIPDEPVIFVANHQSSIDIPLVGILQNRKSHVWLVLEFYVKKPILGFFIRRMFVPVDRANPEKAARSLIKILRFVQGKNRNLIIFPEGTRHVDGKIHEFYDGFAVIAKKIKRPVIPVYMPNNYKAYPPYTFLAYYYPLEVIIGKPFMIEPEETSAHFSMRVKNWFLEQSK